MKGRVSTRGLALLAGTCLISLPCAAHAQQDPRSSVQGQLDSAMKLIEQQQKQLDAHAAEIAELRRRLEVRDGAQMANAAPPGAIVSDGAAQQPSAANAADRPIPLERVGKAPEDEERPIELAVLDTQGSVVTRRGQLSAELQLDYSRSDRSRAVFRGVELIEAVLVGVFDINESRQDLLTASGSLRYGLTDRLELGVRVPFVHRSDTSILAPIAGSTGNDEAATIDTSVKGDSIGDVELTARYQLIDAHGGLPYIIANLQGVIPSGRDPFGIPRDELGRASQAATGAGFWSVSPSMTIIQPSDPVVLFGTLGYTFNLGRNVDTRIPPVIIDYIDPGDSISASAGIGISFNQRTTMNLGYAHSWSLGTTTRTRLLEPTPAWPGSRETQSRDLQIGRLLFGVTYRLSDRASINWAVEAGLTEDAPDLRTVLRIPIALITGS